MKFKIVFLTLLVLGLVFSTSAFAADQFTVGLNAATLAAGTQNFTEDAGAVDIPVLILDFRNDDVALSKAIDAFTVTTSTTSNSAAQTAAGIQGKLNAYHDVNNNGIVDAGDVKLMIASIEMAGDIGNAIDIAFATDNGNVTVAASETETIIVTAETGADFLVGDVIDLVYNPLVANLTTIPVTAAVVAGATDPSDEANTPDITAVALTAGEVVASDVTGTTLIARTIGNKATAAAVMGVTLTNESVADNHMVTNLALATGLGWSAVPGDVTEVRLYEDAGTTLGEYDATDILLSTDGSFSSTAEPIEMYGYLLAPAATVDLLVVFDLSGTGGVAAQVGVASQTDIEVDLGGVGDVDGQDNIGGAAVPVLVSIEPLNVIGVETVDQEGAGGRPDGVLDALKLTFSDDVKDGSWTASGAYLADILIEDETNGTDISPGAFNPTIGNDSANNEVIFLRFDPTTTTPTGPLQGSHYTNGLPEFYYTKSLGYITNLTMDKTLLDIGSGDLVTNGVLTVDMAPPAVVAIMTQDTDANGILDEIWVQFSEDIQALTGNQTAYATNGFTISAGTFHATTGPVLAAGVNLSAPAGQITGIDWSGFTASKLVLTLAEGASGNTGDTPGSTYVQATGELEDAQPPTNQVTGFTPAVEGTSDFAAPVILSATTGDATGDGQIDLYTIGFSEPVQMTGALTMAAAVGAANGFDFNGPDDIIYNFAAAGHTGTGTAEFALIVTPIGVYDTGAKPALEYNGSINISDIASAGSATIDNVLAADVPLSEATYVDDVPAKIEQAITKDGLNPPGSTWANVKNGQVDVIQVDFTESMNPAGPYTSLGVTGGLTVTAAFRVDDIIYLKVTETAAVYNTGITPTISDNGAAISDANGKVVGVFSAVALDGAAPMIYKAATRDSVVAATGAPNGKIDGIKIFFSEVMNASAAVLTADTGNNLDNEFLVSTNAVAGTATDLANGVLFDAGNQSATIYLVEGGVPDTNALPDITWAAAGAAAITDMAASPIALQTIITATIVEVDEAPPAVVAVSTIDADDGTVAGDPDGIIDGADVTMSEAVTIAVEATVLAGITFEAPGLVIENQITLAGGSATLVGGNVIELRGFSDGTTSGTAHPWDTDKVPGIALAAANGIADVALTPNAAIAATVALTTDGAAPVIARASGHVTGDDITITFSEAVQTNGGGALVVSTDLVYTDVFDDAAETTPAPDNDAFAIDGNQTGDLDGSDMEVTVKTLRALLLEDVQGEIGVVDSWDLIALTANVEDVATNAAVAAVNVEFSDLNAPAILTALTQDLDGDGKVDHIKITFSEPIDDSNLNGYIDVAGHAEDYFAIPAAGVWEVDGGAYNVVGINFYDTAAGVLDAATTVLKDAASAKAGVTVVEVTDVIDNNILFLVVEEMTDGDTGITPALDAAGGLSPAGAGVTDFTPNPMATESVTAADGAKPVIMSAQMASETKMNILMSEAMQAALPKMAGADLDPALTADNIFVWAVGNQGTDFVAAGNVLNLTQPSAGTLEVISSAIIPAGVPSTLTMANAGVISDAATIANANVASPAPVTVQTVSEILGAPSDLVITDVPEDNGGFVYFDFIVSSDHPGEATGMLVVGSYEVYRDISSVDDPAEWIGWARIVPYHSIDAVTKRLKVIVPTIDNVESNWKILATTATMTSTDVEAVGKPAGIPVAELINDAAAKTAADVVVSAFSNVYTYGALDEIPPVAPTNFTAVDNPGAGAGVLLTWTTSVDDKIIGQYTINGVSVPVSGVKGYDIYRKAGAAEFVKVGTTLYGVSSYPDPVADGGTIYTYMVRSADDCLLNEAYSLENVAMANNNVLMGDFKQSNFVDIEDFALFGSNYLRESTHAEWDPLFDLDMSGDIVDISDFSLFGNNYLVAQKASKVVPVAEAGVNVGSMMSLNGLSSTEAGDYTVEVALRNVTELKGFDFVLKYDPEKVEFKSATGLGDNLSIVRIDKPGELLVAKVFSNEEVFDGIIRLSFNATGKAGDSVMRLLSGNLVDEGYMKNSVEEANLGMFKVEALPTVFALEQNFPNPFNPTTTIRYAIPKASSVELVIINLNGQVVRSLVNDDQRADFYSVVWDGRNNRGEEVGSGIYFYRLQADKFSAIKKLMLVK